MASSSQQNKCFRNNCKNPSLNNCYFEQNARSCFCSYKCLLETQLGTQVKSFDFCEGTDQHMCAERLDRLKVFLLDHSGERMVFCSHGCLFCVHGGILCEQFNAERKNHSIEMKPAQKSTNNCDCCETEIHFVAYSVNLCGHKFRFCKQQCMDKWCHARLLWEYKTAPTRENHGNKNV